MSYLPYALTADSEEVINFLGPVFIYDGAPTHEYATFLLDAALFATGNNYQAKCDMQTFLQRWEDGGYLTGMIPILVTDHRYVEYTAILRAVYGENPAMIQMTAVDVSKMLINKTQTNDKPTIDVPSTAIISNGIVIHLIQTLMGGCKEKRCHHKSSMHKEWMHQKLRFD